MLFVFGHQKRSEVQYGLNWTMPVSYFMVDFHYESN